MKFGGTSVEDATAIQRTASIVAGRVSAGVVADRRGVCDGQGDGPAAGMQRQRRMRGVATRMWRWIFRRGCATRHLDTASQLVSDPASQDRLDALHASIHQHFDPLDELLRGIAAMGELTARTSDLVVSFGERLSSRMVAAAFAEHGFAVARMSMRAR